MTTEDGTCVHRWMLGSPVGFETEATCKLCGMKRVFSSVRKPAAWRMRSAGGQRTPQSDA